MLLEAVAEVDDELITKYLEGEITARGRFRKRASHWYRQWQLVPVICGSASTTCARRRRLGEALTNYLPSAQATPMTLDNGDSRD